MKREARQGVPEDLSRDTFPRLAEPHRQALKLYCYRMLGSLHDAEDVVQDTFVNAWNALDEFEGRASFKNWLYRIATNTCLNALASRSRRRRLLPEQLGAPSTEVPQGAPATDIAWLQPYPDFELEGIVDSNMGPETRYEMRESVRLAFIAAIQQLPPRQRAILILTDVMEWSAAEVATLLGGSVASINSVLQRARATMRARYREDERQGRSAIDPDHEQLLDRYVQAWESTDLSGFVSLLTEEAIYSMPPWRQWYAGRDSIRNFFGTVWKYYRGFRMVPVAANTQPAFALYTLASEPGLWNAHSLQVLSIRDDRISQLTLFMKPLGPQLFPAFRLPLTLQD
jgi:RNA polymerase sigma-70 factor (ECF subfamily)